MNNQDELETTLLPPIKKHSVRVTRFTIVGIFSGLLLLTISIIIFYTYWSNSASVLEISNLLLKKNTDLVIEKTTNYLEPASTLSRFWSENFKKEHISLKDLRQFHDLSAEMLRSYKQFVSIYYGDEEGHLWGVERKNSHLISKFNLIRQGQSFRNSFLEQEILDEKDKIVKTRKIKIDLIPHTRPWYIGAKNAKGTYWTDVYAFKSEKNQLGITGSYPLYDQNNKLLGVVGCDIEIEELSNFFRQLKIGKSGFGFIINGYNKIIAYPDFSKILIENNNQLRVRTVDELKIEWLSVGLGKHLATGKNMITVKDEVHNENKIISFTSFPESFGKDWKIVLVVPEKDFVGQINETNFHSLIISFVILIISLIIISQISKKISRPIVVLTKETNRITEFELDGDINISSSIEEIQLISTALSRLKRGLRAFKRYLPPLLVKQMLQSDEDVKLGGINKELTIFFSDICNFTEISETMSPEKMMLHLSEYFDELTEVIIECEGTVDKYIGDSIMSFWGAPTNNEKHAYDACRAAVLCQRRLKEMNEVWKNKSMPELHTRIGIHTGDTVVGNVGSSIRLNYSIIGDSVNLTSRLEGVNKIYNTQIIISQSTYEKVKGQIIARPLEFVVVKGKHEPIKIYELLDIVDGDSTEELLEMTRQYEQAFNSYIELEWDSAIEILSGLSQQFPDDGIIENLLNKCKEYKANPPVGNWWYRKLFEK